eukprot:5121702-Amphidinium_carterae.1
MVGSPQKGNSHGGEASSKVPGSHRLQEGCTAGKSLKTKGHPAEPPQKGKIVGCFDVERIAQ